ncbi:hypothetical protein [Streptomyces sp. NPDC050507]|uniref:hypothetical protein n=1 Tax=Streptomyces sp. NPDC050507 TaxID=3365619 RepID=UPI00378F5D8E
MASLNRDVKPHVIGTGDTIRHNGMAMHVLDITPTRNGWVSFLVGIVAEHAVILGEYEFAPWSRVYRQMKATTR